MHKFKILLTVFLFVVAISSAYGSHYLYKKDVFDDIETETDCLNRKKLPNSCQNDVNCCGKWDDIEDECVKGVVKKDKCKRDVNKWIPVLNITALFFFIAVVVNIIYITQ